MALVGFRSCENVGNSVLLVLSVAEAIDAIGAITVCAFCGRKMFHRQSVGRSLTLLLLLLESSSSSSSRWGA